MKSGKVYLEPGSECGQHSTEDKEEQLVFLAGRGVAIIGDEKIQVGKGKVCYIPPQTHHNIKNTSDEPLIYIYCVAPVQDT
jgi:mannose-6-phosphate isomerase-like protein (cupin superfamily)